MMDFICTYVDGKLCTSDENSESCWVKKDKALDMIIAPAIRQRLQSYLDFDGNVDSVNTIFVLFI
ncbi:hypothetical protein [Clostridium sp. CF012]|uniref:hypothetical protein n=1 Tax=Clostridium sp. CF012 TaxID=2843319 RepID=UPI001C0E4077|nr:hypothetical protein [Clostridium sp. CF012]MBU3146750.1 hypothetical protein [Clostridium sp. CF012]